MLRRIWSAVDSIESSRVTFRAWFLGACGIVVVRHLLESALEPPHMLGLCDQTRISFLRFFVHFPASYFWGALAVALLLHLFSRVRIERMLKVVVTFMWVICVPPIVDSIVSGGKGYNLAYFDTFGDMLRAILGFWAPWVDLEGILSPGLRVEFTFIALGAGLYTWHRTGTVWRTCLATVLCPWLVMALLGGLPLLFHALVGTQPYAEITGAHALPEVLRPLVGCAVAVVPDEAFASLNLLLLLLFAAACYWRYSATKFRALLHNTRLYRCAHYCALMFAGAAIGYFAMLRKADVPWVAADSLAVVTATLGLLCAIQATIVVNDLSDASSDLISNPGRPLACGVLGQSEFRAVGVVFFVLSLAFSFVAGHYFFLMVLTFFALYYVYSAPPFRLKRFFPINMALITANCLLALVAGLALFAKWGTYQHLSAKVIALVVVPCLLGVHVITLKDVEADRQSGVATIPVLLGEKSGKRLISAMILVAALFPALILGIPWLWAPAAIFALAGALVVLAKRWRERIFFAGYLAYFGVVAAACLIRALSSLDG
jgi:4-hydroxybenzoate polyprenyltransferase